MRAAVLLTRSELRRRWPSLLLLAVLIAVTGGVTLTAVAGARRTASSYDRFLEVSKNQDAILFADDVRPADVARLRQMPGVDAIGYARQMTIVRPNGEFLAVGGALDDVIFRDVYRLRIVEGRAVAPGRADEVVIGEPLARSNGLRVGHTLDLQSFSPAQVAALNDPGSIANPETFPAPKGPNIRLRVVGISRSPSDLSLQGSAGGLLLLSKDFVDKYGSRVGNFSGPHGGVLLARLTDHAAGVPHFLEQVRSVLGARQFDVDPAALSIGGVQDSIDMLTIAVLAVGAIAGVAGLIALALTISRQTALIAARQGPVRDLGLPRLPRAVAIGAPVLAAVVGGAAAALLVAWAASPLLPFGVARQAEPNPGAHFDTLVLLAGTLGIIVIVGTIVAVNAWRAARTPTARPSALRPSLLTRTVEGLGLAPPAGIGVRMALEPRSGRTSVPVRSSLVGAGVAVLGLVSVAVFGASLHHLHTTPADYGRPWDVRVVDTRETLAQKNHLCGSLKTRLTSNADIATITNACTVSIELDGRGIGAFGMTPLRGTFTPTVLVGRAPRATDEIALGSQTLDALHRKIGDRVTARTRSGAFGYTIVGRVVVPALSDPQAIADGAVLTGDGVQRLIGDDTGGTSGLTSNLLVRFRAGVDKADAAARIRKLPGIGAFEDPGVVAVEVPLEVERLDQINRMPLVLGIFLAVVGGIAVSHLLVTSVRRRRRDFAVLKSIGFTRRQVLATVSWQATTVAVAGLAVGVILGIVCGSLLWRAVANQVGVLPAVAIPAGILAGVALATLVVANVVAAFPARSAARTQPAVTLRSE